MIEVNNLTKTVVDEELLKNLGQKILDQEGIEKEVEVSVALVEEKEIQELNRIFRDEDEPTDVLSFEEGSKFVSPPAEVKQLGEIVICPSQIKDSPQGVGRLFVHGLLHLLGYNHQTEKEAEIMESKEKKYLTLFSNEHGSG